MKRIIASAGAFAVGAAGLNAANPGDLPPEMAAKRWNFSAALRGFYDDNFATRPSGPLRQGSAGVQFNPTASFNLPLEQTFLSASYSLSLLYYFDRPGDEIDQNHTVDLKLNHQFTPRHRLRLQETFVYSKEPTLVEQGATVSVPIRTGVEGIRNVLPAEFEWQLTRLFSLALGYQNSYYHYFDSGDGSYSALLNRVENLFRVDARYQLREHSTALVGYQYGRVNYTSSDHLTPDPASLKASVRDSQSHYLYVGYEQEFANHLSLAVRGGGTLIEYPNLNQTEVSPYFDLALTYQYLPGDTLRIGVKQAHNATDIAGAATSAKDVVRDQDTTTLYLALSHRLTPKLTAGATVQYQHSIYGGGSLDGKADEYLTLALTAAYKFTRNWAAELEYDFDELVSDVPGREFYRNRVYGGVRFIF